MFYYRLGIHGYESSDFVTLANEKEYTEEEFERCIVDVTPDCIKRYIDYLIREHKEFVDIVKFNDIDHWVVAALCEKYGFHKITPISTTEIWMMLLKFLCIMLSAGVVLLWVL